MSGPRSLRNFIAGEYVDGRTESTTDIVNPATGSVVATAPVSGQADVDAAYGAARDGLRGVGSHDPERAPAGPAEDRRRDRGARRRAHRARVREHRQDPGAHRERGDPADGRPAAVLRRGGPGARGQGRRGVHEGPHLVDPARADRRRRPGHPVELPAAHGRVEDRPGAGRRQHRGAQAERHHPRDHPAPGRDRLRVPPGRRPQRHHRRPRHRPDARRAPHPRPGRHHRLGPRRRRGRGQRRPERQARAPRARRQGPGRGLRRRRHRGGGRGHRHRRLLQRRPGLHRGDPRARRTRHPRRLRRRARRVRPQLGPGRAPDRRGRPVRPGQQRPPARPRVGLHRPAARRTRRSRPVATAAPTSATATTSSRPCSPA